MTLFDCAGPDPNPRPASIPPPPRACDCHAHVIGPAADYPFVAERSYTPPDALLGDYLNVLGALGLGRAVLVQPSMHGTDNRAMLHAVASVRARGAPQMRAIAAIQRDCLDRELQELHEGGVRGVRLNLIYRGGGEDFASAPEIAARIRNLGWCLELLADVSQLGSRLLELDGLGVPLVVDHLGHMPARKGPDDPGFQALLELVRRGNGWVKLSGAYRLADGNEFPAEEISALALALVAAAPSRILWGTDWPHTMCSVPMPNDGELLDLLAAWVPDARQRNRILVENPAALYGFDGD